MDTDEDEPDIMLGCERSRCPVSSALDILGDKWTLLVVRDLLLGKTTYSEFQKSPEGIPTNVLAERLKRLVAAEIVARNAYQQRPVRYAYTLTEKGRELAPVILAMLEWGRRHIPGTMTVPEEVLNLFRSLDAEVSRRIGKEADPA